MKNTEKSNRDTWVSVKCLILIKLHPRGEDKILKDTVYLKRDVFKK